MRLSLPFVCLLLASGCTQHASLVPLCGEDDAFRDDRILGTWHPSKAAPGADDQRIATVGYDEDTSLAFTRRDSGSYRLTVARTDREMSFECRIAAVGEHVETDSMLLFAGTTEELNELIDAHTSELFVESVHDAILRRQADR